jgi:hypothetical protein
MKEESQLKVIISFRRSKPHSSMVVAAAAIPMTTFDARSIVKGFIPSKDKIKKTIPQ